MAAITRTKSLVRPLAGAVIRKGTAGGTIEAGEAVYLDGANGWKVADGSAAASALARGIAVAPQDISSGDVFDICVFGPIEGYSSATPGSLAYVSDTAGELDTAAGTKTMILGWFESATKFVVNPSMAADPT